jgi:NAD(P)H-dependent flavin oxidoreductase YrpB (nitropropane dioxygenase family)
MNVAAGPELAAAVTNAGGLGVIGGVGYTPKILRSQVRSCYFSLPGCSSEYTPDVGKAILTFYS